jgi:hypothetical protein
MNKMVNFSLETNDVKVRSLEKKRQRILLRGRQPYEICELPVLTSVLPILTIVILTVIPPIRCVFCLSILTF